MIREKIASSIVIFMFSLLILGLFNLEIIQGRKFKELSDSNSIRLIPKLGCRGKILDRTGSVVADSQLFYDAMILPQDINGLDRELNVVSTILGISIADLKKAYKASYIAPAVPITIAKNIDIKKAICLEELKPNLPGVIVQARPARYYPYGRLASHVLGYINEIDRWRMTKLEDYGYKTKDLVGFGGIEEKYDYYLREAEGGLALQVNHRGRSVRVLGFQSPQNGKEIQLTLDLRVQKIAEEALGGKKGSVVILEPYTGEVIAMVSAPSFNPAAFVNKNNSAISGFFADSDAPLINRAISSVYPAGSVFKPIVATAALEEKKINLTTSFLCQGSTLVGRQEFKCWSTHGVQDIVNALAHSCNVFFYKTGLMVGAPLLHDYAIKFGLAKTTGFDLPYETAGYIPSPLLKRINRLKGWYDGDTANLSIGQGDVSVTPIQMARMIAVFANRGYLVTPYIVKAVAGQDIIRYHKKAVNIHLKDSTIEAVRQGLRRVVANPEGTGRIFSELSVAVAGKTGTAQAPPGQPHAWFVGFFPFKEPKYAICVFLEHAGPGYYSCVVGKQIIEGMIKEGLI